MGPAAVVHHHSYNDELSGWDNATRIFMDSVASSVIVIDGRDLYVC